MRDQVDRWPEDATSEDGYVVRYLNVHADRISRLKSGNLRQAAFGLTAIRHMPSSIFHLQLYITGLFISYLLPVVFICT
jgi:hypothetical protein